MEYDDLVGYGIFGLIDAIDKFDYGKNVKFETYASLRIRGAILDQIRKMDWIPRSLRQKQKRIEAAMAKIESETGHIASDIRLDAFIFPCQSASSSIVISNSAAIDSLTEKERSVVVLYYYEDMTLKEISLTLEVSESRVSQLHTKALNKMKKILGDYVFSL